MKVFILCGGQGTRLREHTESRPKPMVEIGGKPIVWHIMKSYAYYGFDDFIMCLGYKGYLIKDYFLHYETRNSDFTIELGAPNSIELHGCSHDEDGWTITLVDTGEATQTGGRICRAARHLSPEDDRFMVTYGDGVADVNFDQALAFHRSHGALATVTGVAPPGRFGALRLEGARVANFSEKPEQDTGMINGGFFIFEREALDYLRPDEDCILEREPLERLAEDGQLFVYEHRGYWQCMDTYRDWQRLEQRWESGDAPWARWRNHRTAAAALALA